jgi:hypothetical protein
MPTPEATPLELFADVAEDPGNAQELTSLVLP